MPRTKKNLEAKNKELSEALQASSAFAHSAAVSAVEAPTMVPVKNFGGTYIVYTYEFRGSPKRLELDTSGRKQTGAVPLEIYNEIERDTVFVRDGSIVRIDVPIDNPNVVEDVQKLVEKSSEVDFAKRISVMTNPNAVYRILDFVDPLKNKTGKLLSAQRALRAKIEELTGTKIVDDTE